MKIVELEEIINNAFKNLQNISEKSDTNILNDVEVTKCNFSNPIQFFK